ncbi:MAG TPA: DUF898 family protein [Alphaproteobacteria bacterium]|nr:DUF898 family protein [Alphaproteobacteria bacterium]HNS43986.1 DUF898 family protein [Alphaproteobacteria bacterium]
MSFIGKPPETGDPATNAESRPKISAPAEKRIPVKTPATRMTYRGRIGELMGIHIINLLLSIITLGIYSFWGKTRIRRYMTSHIVLSKDRFEYTGTGKELLLGWLKALLIFLPVIFALQIPGLNLIALPIFFGIISVAVYLAMRYRLSRTRWRGIRFSLAGSAKSYLWLAIKRTLINVFTLGFKIPKSDIMKWSYIANNMRYGDINFKFDGTHKGLLKTHIITILIGIALIVVGNSIAMSVIMAGKMSEMGHAQARVEKLTSQPTQTFQSQGIKAVPYYEETQKSPEDLKREEAKKLLSEVKAIMLPMILTTYFFIFVAVAIRLWYHAALWRAKFRALSVGGIRFKANITGGGLLKLYGGNLLIIIFTLGIGKPIALHRTLAFFTRNIMIGGDLEALKAEQGKNAGPTGMGDALAADVGFDLGL